MILPSIFEGGKNEIGFHTRLLQVMEPSFLDSLQAFRGEGIRDENSTRVEPWSAQPALNAETMTVKPSVDANRCSCVDNFKCNRMHVRVQPLMDSLEAFMKEKEDAEEQRNRAMGQVAKCRSSERCWTKPTPSKQQQKQKRSNRKRSSAKTVCTGLANSRLTRQTRTSAGASGWNNGATRGAWWWAIAVVSNIGAF